MASPPRPLTCLAAYVSGPGDKRGTIDNLTGMKEGLEWPRILTARLWASVLLVCALVGAGSPGLAQDALDSNQVVGKWVGTISSRGNPNPVEVEFKPDGVFGGSVSSSQLGLVNYLGRWKVEGPAVFVDYTVQTATRTAESSWTLRQDGDGLSGTGLRKSDQIRFDVSLKRAK